MQIHLLSESRAYGRYFHKDCFTNEWILIVEARCGSISQGPNDI